MDFFDKFKSLETNPIYGEKEVDIGIYKIYSEKIGDYLIDLPHAGYPSIEIKSPYFAIEVMLGLQKVLRKKFPCSECDGCGHSEHLDLLIICETCNGTGIAIPESEA